ncbi:hypothetical protein [Kitasatospora cathayae]|uniref:PilZ domain-containing protein n=1 Tax=Kitasatospora cathayae TaxID=3004092 RepID=A0ABY7Q9N8_9ACTN|nr:hypothetical protein [Kitasatospora sp. HUAS 3-15]WBP89276.1 hypothetical protein O1G21_27820 [Kitasatospora sp. HUAS 3-15]
MGSLPTMRLRCVGADLVHRNDWLNLIWDAGGELHLPLDSCTRLDTRRIEEDGCTQIVLSFAPLTECGTRGAGWINVRLEVTAEHNADAHEFLQFVRRWTAEEGAAAVPRRSGEEDWISFPPADEARELYEQVLQRTGGHRPL